MPEPANLLAFALAALVLNLTPGPDMLYCLTRAATHGPRGALAASLGNILGTLVHAAAAVLGLSALLATSAEAFALLKLAGAAYLVYLGLRLLLTPALLADPIPAADSSPVPSRGPSRSLRRVAAESFLIHTLNPKVAVFFVAFVPQFVTPTAASAQLAFLGLWYALQAGAVLLTIGLLAARARRGVTIRPVWTRWARRAAGGVFMLLGGKLALAKA